MKPANRTVSFSTTLPTRRTPPTIFKKENPFQPPALVTPLPKDEVSRYETLLDQQGKIIEEQNKMILRLTQLLSDLNSVNKIVI